MNTKKMLVKENPKALQFLHNAHGFDFEKPFYIGSIPGRFTYKMVNDCIKANIGDDFVSVVLVKPKSYLYERLHYATMKAGKFSISVDRAKVRTWAFNVDTFVSVSDFEETRKSRTECVYIIAQKPEYMVTPKTEKTLRPNERYKVMDSVGRCADGRGKVWINEIKLRRNDGSRNVTSYKPWNSFYPGENQSNVLEDYVDKSGYIVRMRRMELAGQAKKLKAQHNAEELARTDFSARKASVDAGIAAAKKFLADAIMAASTKQEVRSIEGKISSLEWVFYDVDKAENGFFSNVAAKNRHYDELERKIREILT